MKIKIITLLLFCITSLAFARGNLDGAINAQGQFLLGRIPPNSILAIVGISSGSEDLSRYVTENLTSHIINNNDKNIRIVEREAMPLLQQELEFQYSGEVDDDFIVSLGRMIGANTVIAGTIYSIGSELHFNIRAVNIETSVIIASNGINFRSDNRVRSLLHGDNVRETLSRENIPVRNSDGTVSRANLELRENRRRAVETTRQTSANFFSKEFYDREPRLTLGYAYSPEIPFGIDWGLLKNGLGGYITANMDFSYFDIDGYTWTHQGQTIGFLNFGIGMTYPLHFDWLWLSGGLEFPIVERAVRKLQFSTIRETVEWETEEKTGFGMSFGTFVSVRRFYFFARYIHLFDVDINNNFMLGIGISFDTDI